MKNWNELTADEKREHVRTLNDTYGFSQYTDAETAAYNVRQGYENGPDWFDFEVTDLDQFEEDMAGYITGYIRTYDVQFDDDTASNNEGWRNTLQECKDWIDMYNGTDESYFMDYKGGTVSIVCNETGETVYEEGIPEPVKTMQQLADYINASEDFPADVERIIEANGWTSDTFTEWGVCHDDTAKVVMNERGEAEVI